MWGGGVRCGDGHGLNGPRSWDLAVGGGWGGGGSTGVGAEVRVMVPTLGGYPYDIDISAWDPYRVAGKLSNVRIQ